MGIFDELSNTQRMEDPEDRKAKDLGRSEKRLKRSTRSKSTSVSANSFIWRMTLLKAVLFLGLLATVAYVAYQGIMLFIP